MGMNRFFTPRGTVLWFTGLPSSGKTTIAQELKSQLESEFVPAILLDGDAVRPIIADAVDYSEDGRLKSLYKYIDLAKILVNSNVIVIIATNNHVQKQRDIARESFADGQYVELWVDTPLEVCKQRDVKGLYALAEQGEINDLVGVSIEYERPVHPDIIIQTAHCSPGQASQTIISFLKEKQVIVQMLDVK